MKPASERHLSWEFLKQRLDRAVPNNEVIEGTPRCEVFIDAGATRLGLRVHSKAAKDEQLPFFSALECVRVKDDVHLSCTDKNHYQEFYGFLTAVADRVQLRSMPVDEAIADAADSVKHLLAGGAALTLERQLGLWGELWTLSEIADRLDWKTAVKAWVATAESPEEHDFALDSADLEVKTTNLELRHHHITERAKEK